MPGFLNDIPALAFACWYAKGNGMIAVMISGVTILYRKPKEFAIEMGLSFVVAFLYQSVVPYWG